QAPDDAIDSCCLTHDRCIEANLGVGLSNPEAHACCDPVLDECAMNVRDKGLCAGSKDPDGCRQAADLIFQVFAPIGLGYALFHRGVRCLPVADYDFWSRLQWGDPNSASPSCKPWSKDAGW